MGNNVKYLSYSGLSHFKDRVFEVINPLMSENKANILSIQNFLENPVFEEVNTNTLNVISEINLNGTRLFNFDFLPLSGGTMTGTINSQNIIPTYNSSYNLGSSTKQFNTTYTRYVDTVSGFNLRLRSGGVEHLNMIDGSVNSTANIMPTATNTYNLGSSSLKWKNVYANEVVATNFIENGASINTIYAAKSYADYCSSYLHSANRAQFCKPAGVTLEYSTDSGSTWVDYGATDEQKIGFFSGISQGFYLGKKLSTKALASDMLRLTMDATAMGFYTSCKSLLINISTNGSSNFRVKVERSMKGSVDTFTTLIESQTLTGWSGWNRIPIGYSFGGGDTQTYNIAKLRLTFMSDGAGSSYTSGAHSCVLDMEVLGSTYWTVPHTMAKTGHIYSWDYLGNAIFSKNITAPEFIGNLTGNVTGNLTGNVTGNVVGNLTGDVNGIADIAKTLPYFTIISNGTLPSDGSPEYVKFATITIPTTVWARKSVTLFFQDYEAFGYQGDILTIQTSSNASGVGSTPSVKWVTKYQKSTIGNIIISKVSDNVYDLYLEATILPYVTLRVFYLTTDDVGTGKVFNFINNASSWSTTAPVITSRSTLKNVASELGSAKTLWGQSFDGTGNVSGDMTGVGSIAMSKALTINGSDSDTANLHFGRTSYNYITGPSGSTIHMCPGGISKSSTTGYIFSSTAFYPGTTNAYSIGTTSLQWNNICGKTLYENGTSLANKYAQIINSFITNRTSTDNLTAAQITSYADLSTSSAGQSAFKLLNTGSYNVARSGSSELLINLGTNTGSTSALEFLTNYTHTSRLKVRKIIDSNRVSGAFKELAWYSDIPTKVSQLTNDAGYTTASGHTHSKLSSTGISFTPPETALTPDNVYTLIGGTTIKRGTQSYAANGYISNDTTGCGVIDLAGTTVIQADNGTTAYTQLYLTPSTGRTTDCKTNEIFMYNNNGSGYSPSWTRILTNRNYSDYCAAIEHNHSAANITSGTLSVSRGGTGLSTITAGHVIIGNGTGTPITAKIISLTNTEIDAIFTDLGVTF